MRSENDFIGRKIKLWRRLRAHNTNGCDEFWKDIATRNSSGEISFAISLASASLLFSRLARTLEFWFLKTSLSPWIKSLSRSRPLSFKIWDKWTTNRQAFGLCVLMIYYFYIVLNSFYSYHTNGVIFNIINDSLALPLFRNWNQKNIPLCIFDLIYFFVGH